MDKIAIPDSMPDWVKAHVDLYLKDGEAAHLWDASLGGGKGMLTTLLLFTEGRRSGRTSVLPLIYRPTEDGGYCVIASKGGAPSHPLWFLNLQANPHVHVKVANREFDAVARVAQGKERARLWQTLVDYYPPYADYQAATEREIPVVVLNPNT